MGATAEGIKGKIASLKGRLVSVTKAAELLAVAEELSALGAELAREESAASGAATAWPRDMNGGSETTSEWGKDPAESGDG